METLPSLKFLRSAFISASSAAFCAGVTSLVYMSWTSFCIVPNSVAKIDPPLPLPAHTPAAKRTPIITSEAAPQPNGTHRGNSGRTSDSGAA